MFEPNPQDNSNSVTYSGTDTFHSREACLASLKEFIAETDTLEALRFCFADVAGHPKIKKTNNIVSTINRTIAQIDHLIKDQLNIIIHSEKFKKLEASWRGLWYLADQAGGTRNIKLKVLDINWAEVVKDIERALEFDQSQLFQKIYSEEYDAPGGEPYSVLIGDYEVSHRPSPRHPSDDITTLQGIAQVAAASFAPFIASASSEFFGLDDFSSLGLPLNLPKIFSQREYAQWRSLREKADSRFIGLTLPHILMRRPYRTKPGSYKGLFFYEKPIHCADEQFLWGNACYAFASILIREFANVGWFGHIRGVPRNEIGGGLLTNLPVDSFATDKEGIATRPVTDVIITDQVEKEISDLGLIPLCQCYDTPFAAFYSNPSIQNPKGVTQKGVEVNAKLSAMLQHVLCASRIAHYIKMMVQDKTGSFITAEECENYLRDWLFQYTSNREDLAWEEQARYPLKDSRVSVREHPQRKGHFLSKIHLVPHYQLEQMVTELELVTELVQTG